MAQQFRYFSIVIPTFNRPRELIACLENLCCLHYPRDRFEVIVVVDGGVNPTAGAVARIHSQLDLKILKQSHAGPATARNSGSAAAKGEFLCFLDDDCMPAADWLLNLTKRFFTEPECAVGGTTINALSENPYASVSQLLVDYLYLYYNSDPDRVRFLTSNNLALPASRFGALGGFDSNYRLAAAEDRDFCQRWLQHGFRLVHAPEVRVFHAHALGFRSFWRQHFNYGRGAFFFHQENKQGKRWQMRFQSGSLHINLFRYVSSLGGGREALLVLISQAATAAGFVWEWATRNHLKKQVGEKY